MAKKLKTWGIDWKHIKSGTYRLYEDDLPKSFEVIRNKEGKWFIRGSTYDGINRKTTRKAIGNFDTAKQAMEIAEKIYSRKEHTYYKGIFQ